MSWNIFKRIALLEEASAKNIAVIDALNRRSTSLQDQNYAHSKWLTSLENRLQEMGRRLNPYAAAPVHSEGEPVFTEAEVDQEKEKKRLYQREWYAKKVAKIKMEKAAQAAREKKNAYARAYYARTKGEKK